MGKILEVHVLVSQICVKGIAHENPIKIMSNDILNIFIQTHKFQLPACLL